MAGYDPHQYPDPYQQHGGYQYGAHPPMPGMKPKLPTYCLVMFILDLIFCSLRLILSCFSVASVAILQEQNHPLAETAIAEAITNVGIGLFGVAGNGLMLGRKEIGMYLGYLAVLFTVGSFGVGIWQSIIQMEHPDPNLAEVPENARWAMLGFFMLLRLGLLVAYIAALVKFGSFMRETRTPSGDMADYGRSY